MAVTMTTTNCFFQALTYPDAYFEVLYHRAATWAALTDDQKEQLLIQATFMLLNYVDWLSDPDLTDPETEQKDACCELAYFLLTKDRMSEHDGQGIKSVEAGEVAVEFAKGDIQPLIPFHVLKIVEDYISGSINSNTVSLSRA